MYALLYDAYILLTSVLLFLSLMLNICNTHVHYYYLMTTKWGEIFDKKYVPDFICTCVYFNF